MSSTTNVSADRDDEAPLLASRGPVPVYEAPVRLWHWINVLAVVVLAVSGYIIANPLPSVPGEASEHFLMGYIRFAHFAAAYVFAVGFLGRIYWAVVGNRYARRIFYLPVWRRSWWEGVLHQARWYAFLDKEPRKYVGHNPLAHLSMFFMFTLTTIFMIFTGGAMYAEGAGRDSWQHAVFGWVGTLFGNSQNLHTWHHVGMWVIVVFAIIHVYVAIREEIMSRQTMLSAIIGGARMFKDDRP